MKFLLARAWKRKGRAGENVGEPQNMLERGLDDTILVENWYHYSYVEV